MVTSSSETKKTVFVEPQILRLIKAIFGGFKEDDRLALQGDIQSSLIEVFKTLSFREVEVLIRRFGLRDGIAETLAKVGEGFGVTKERIRQIEAKALRKLRHTDRTQLLKSHLISMPPLVETVEDKGREIKRIQKLRVKTMTCGNTGLVKECEWMIAQLRREIVSELEPKTIAMQEQSRNMYQVKRALVYLWTRDAGMPVDGDTEEYITGQLKAISGGANLAYSDKQRLAMADRIVGGEGNVELRD